MPILPVIAGLAGVAGSLISSSANRKNQNALNEQQRQHEINMMNTQNEWNLQQWHRQNDYNSPLAQMQRFQEAGLNPHLMYGRGDSGQASAMTSAGAGSWNPKNANLDFDIQKGLMAYHDFRLKTAQYDNIREQNNVLRQEAILKAHQSLNTIANTANTESNTELSKFNLKKGESLFDTDLQAAQENIKALQRRSIIEYNIEAREQDKHPLHMEQLRNTEAREQAKHTLNLEQLKKNILKTAVSIDLDKTQIKRLESSMSKETVEKVLLELEHQIRKTGGNPNDPAWQKVILNTLGDLGILEDGHLAPEINPSLFINQKLKGRRQKGSQDLDDHR